MIDNTPDLGANNITGTSENGLDIAPEVVVSEDGGKDTSACSDDIGEAESFSQSRC